MTFLRSAGPKPVLAPIRDIFFVAALCFYAARDYHFHAAVLEAVRQVSRGPAEFR